MKHARKAVAIHMVIMLLFGFVVSAFGQEDLPRGPRERPGGLDSSPLSESGNPVLSLMARSYSARRFIEGAVCPVDIERILTAGAMAPSARNAQPWHFTVTTNFDIISALLPAARPGNALIIVSGDPTPFPLTMHFDNGLATQNMQLAAEALGYGARQYISPIPEIEANRRDQLGIPEGNVVLVALLIGPTDPGIDAITYATPRNPLERHVNFVE